MSKVSGACGAMVGCRLEAGFQALKRAPPQAKYAALASASALRQKGRR
jgi:hypothetical protein